MNEPIFVYEFEWSLVANNVLDTVIDESVTVYELFKESGISTEHAEKSAQIMENYFNEYAKKKKINESVNHQEQPIDKFLERDVCRKILESCNLTREQDQKLRKIVQICFKNFYFREKTYKLKVDMSGKFNFSTNFPHLLLVNSTSWCSLGEPCRKDFRHLSTICTGKIEIRQSGCRHSISLSQLLRSEDAKRDSEIPWVRDENSSKFIQRWKFLLKKWKLWSTTDTFPWLHGAKKIGRNESSCS